MVELETGTLNSVLDRWRDATREALQEGVTPGDLHTMLDTEAATGQDIPSDSCPIAECDADIIYSVLPPGLIDLPSAVKKYGVKLTTLHYWLRQGHLEPRGRLRAPAVGGGYVIVSESEIERHMEAPRNKGGRPKKPI